MIIEVVGHKGVVGNATYQLLKAYGYSVYARDKGDPLPGRVDVSFLCVMEDNVKELCAEVSKYTKLIVVRSTVKPGVCEGLKGELDIHICHMPEFLREATAVMDSFNQNFILIGGCCFKHKALLRDMFAPACVPIIETNPDTAAMVKIAINNNLACQISFWNEIEAIAAASGVSGHQIGAIASLDPRVSNYGARFHNKYDGKCLPKEIKQMQEYAKMCGVETPLLDAVEKVNQCQKSL